MDQASVRWEDAPPRWDPASRVEKIAHGGVGAEVLDPTPRPADTVVAQADAEYLWP
jgi:hypothetical protein